MDPLHKCRCGALFLVHITGMPIARYRISGNRSVLLSGKVVKLLSCAVVSGYLVVGFIWAWHLYMVAFVAIAYLVMHSMLYACLISLEVVNNGQYGWLFAVLVCTCASTVIGACGVGA